MFALRSSKGEMRSSSEFKPRTSRQCALGSPFPQILDCITPEILISIYRCIFTNGNQVWGCDLKWHRSLFACSRLIIRKSAAASKIFSTTLKSLAKFGWWYKISLNLLGISTKCTMCPRIICSDELEIKH